MIQKTLTRILLSTAILAGLFTLIPSHAYAIDFNPLNPLDPFCLFSCDFDNEPQTVYNTTTGSYNTDSYNTNSYNGNTSIATPGVYSAPIYTAPVYNTPVQATPVYNYTTTYVQSSPLSVSCYPTPTTANVGSSVSWGSSVSGGSGSTYISWSGSEGLYGNGSSISKSYSYAGSKNASITVTSGSQTVSQNCSGTVTVHDYTSNYSTPVYHYNTPVVYSPPVIYSSPTYYYSPLTVSCRSNTTFTPVGSYVTWTAYPSGGYNNNYGAYQNYSYSWSGTDTLYGSSSSISAYYSTPGIKTAYVTLYSNGSSVSAQCLDSVTVGYNNYVTQYSNQYSSNLGLQIACAADTVTTKVGTPVTWVVEAVSAGGYSANNLSYAWTGSDGLSGNQSSIVKSYSTSGSKSAVVTVTNPAGQSQSKACSNTISVKSATVAKKAPVKVAPEVVTTSPATAASTSLLSLQSVPWGWVAILVVLVLMGMIFYLVFNKKKI